MAIVKGKRQVRKAPAGKLARENAALRRTVEGAVQANQALISRLASTGSHASADLVVGIRNISDNTVGLKSPFANEPPIQLHASLGENGPGEVAVISYAWYQRLRTSGFMEQGLIMRDDSILSGSQNAAPPDREGEIPDKWAVNAILDPHEWIQGQNEAEIREGLDAITSVDSLRRLRRAVDDKLREIQNGLSFAKDDPRRARVALKRLPVLYQLVDQITTLKLEGGMNDELEEQD